MQRCKCLWFSAEVLSLNSGREADLSCFVTLLRHHIPLLASLPKGIINNSPQLLRGPSVPHALFVWRRPFTTAALVGGVSRLPSYRWENGASKGNSRAVSLTAPPCTRHCLWVTYVGWDVCVHGRTGKQDPPGNQLELFPKFFS